MSNAELFSAIASGARGVGELAGVGVETIARIRALGVTAFTCGRHEQAAAIFAGLEALEPQVAQHSLYLAHALSALHRTQEARDAVSRHLAIADSTCVERVRALLLRVSLSLALGERAEAAADLSRARDTGQENSEAQVLLAAFGAAR